MQLYAQDWVSSKEMERSVPRTLSDEQYLDSIEAKIGYYTSQGRYFQKDTLVNTLKHYKHILWSNEKYKKGRITYFSILANNAGLQSRTGEAIYYYEKLEQERKKQGISGSLHFSTFQKVLLYIDSRQFEKAIDEFEQRKKYLDALPAKISSGELKDPYEALSIFSIIKEVGYSYAMVQDTAGLEDLIFYSKRLLDVMSLKQGSVYRKEDLVVVQFVTQALDFFKYSRIYKDAKETYNALSRIRQLSTDTALGNARSSYIKTNCEYWLMDYFASLSKNIDSLRHYLRAYENNPQMSVNSTKGYKVKYYGLLLHSLETHNDTIIPLIDDLLLEKDSIVLRVSKELEDNLYAQAKADDLATELQKSEKAKKMRTTIIIGTALLAFLISSIIYFRMRSKNRRTQEKIASINQLANLKIAELEEARSQAAQNERENLSRELHDDFSATLAGLKQQADILKKQTGDQQLLDKITKLASGLNYVYTASRKKSHQWYQESLQQQQVSFKETITFLVNSALPDNQYEKEIQIEAGAVRYLSIEGRINVLRIIQEATANIIKHSKASEVSIFLSHTDEGIILQIGDNGIGITTNKKSPTKGMGMLSIDKRVKEMKGSWDLINDEGTLVSIRLPK